MFHFFPHPGRDFELLLGLVGRGCEGLVENSAIAFPTSRIKGFFSPNVCLAIPRMSVSMITRLYCAIIRFAEKMKLAHILSCSAECALVGFTETALGSPPLRPKTSTQTTWSGFVWIEIHQPFWASSISEKKRLDLAVKYCKKFDDCSIYADVCDKGMRKINA